MFKYIIFIRCRPLLIFKRLQLSDYVVVRIARERTIVKLAITELSKFLDYLIYNISNGMRRDLEDSLDWRITISNILMLSFKYLIDFPQISFLTSDIARYILNRQVNKRGSSGIYYKELDGAWCELRKIDGILSGKKIRLTDDIYNSILYQTSRALEALGHAKGMSMAPVIRGFRFIERFIGKVDIDELEGTKFFVPIMDAIYSCADVVSYDQSQKLLLPLARKMNEIVMKIDPRAIDIHTQEIIIKTKILEGRGLGQDDFERITVNLEKNVLRHILKGIEWLLSFNVEVPPRIHELLMDMLTNNFAAVFDIHKNQNLIYYISNTETLVNLIHKLSDKKFAQFILDQTTEYISDVLLPGVEDVYSATKLLLITKLLIESRAVIRR